MDPSSSGRRPSDTSSDTPLGPGSADDVKTIRISADGNSSTASSTNIISFRVIGPYIVEQVLNHGGMGVIYKAYDTRLKRPVALKMILSNELIDSAMVARFRSEAEAVAALQHPNIVQIYEVGEHDGLPYLALELVDGPSLQERLKDGPLSAPEAALLTLAIAKAIDFAHHRGIVHCDLKPGNILMADHQTPKVTDFGLARWRDTPTWQSRPGEVLGTPNYMAPEQAEGDPKRIGPPADIYALGAILYELLTGLPPYHGTPPAETLMRIRLTRPTPPRLLRPRIPRDLEAICLKCLEKDPAERYATARDLADDLQRFRERRPVAARPVGSLMKTWKWMQRKPVVAAMAVLLLLSLGVFHTVVYLQWQQLQKTSRELERQRNNLKKTQEDLDTQRWQLDQACRAAEQSRQKAEWALYRSLLAEADREFSAHSAKRARQILNQCPEHLRAWEWHYLYRRFEGTPRTQNVPADAVCALGSIAQSAGFFLVQRDGQIRTLNTQLQSDHVPVRLEWKADESLQQLWPHTRVFPSLARLISGCVANHRESGSTRHYLALWELPTGRLLHSWPITEGTVLDTALSPDGQTLAVVYDSPPPDQPHRHFQGGGLIFYDLTSGRCSGQQSLPKEDPSFCSVAFLPDGKQVVACRESKDLWVFQRASGTISARLPMPKGYSRLMGVHPNRPWLLVRTNSSLSFIDLDGVIQTDFDGHFSAINQVSFSASGSLLATASSDQSVRIWDVATGRCIGVLAGHRAPVQAAVFLSESGWLASIDQKGILKVWELEAGGVIRLDMEAPLDWTPSLGFGPDGKWLAAAKGMGVVVIWDLASRQRLTKLYSSFGLTSMSVSPDGQLLAVVTSLPNQVAIIDRATGKTKHVWRTRQGLEKVVFAPDGRHIIVTCERGLAVLVHFESGEIVAECTQHQGAVTSATHHPQRRLIATGDQTGMVYLWGMGRFPQRSIKAHDTPVSCAAFSPDGRYLATGLRNRERPDIPAVIRIWNVATGELVRELRGHEQSVWCLAWHPDSQRLASGSEDKTVRIWDPIEGQSLLTLNGPTDDVRCLAFSPDGRLLASSCDDRFVRIWDATPVNSSDNED